jgi:hypothetical protein
MKTQSSRKVLMEVFDYADWRELKANLKDAQHPMPITLNWKCIAKGRRRDGRVCIFNERLKDDPAIDGSYVAEHFTYLRFSADPTIWRYCNSREMQNEIREFDLDGHSDLEEGDSFVLEPMTTARSHQYATKRREGIRAGEWQVRPRGPNVNKRKWSQHHSRPF